MADSIELRELIKTLLNNTDNLVDPFPTRKGQHFYTESDGFNFNRGDTFPKGFIVVSDKPEPELSSFSRKGHALYSCTIDIFYYVKEKDKYTDPTNGFTYTGKDLAEYIITKITRLIPNNPFSNYVLRTTSIGQIAPTIPVNEGSLKLFQTMVPITFYWSEVYGPGN